MQKLEICVPLMAKVHRMVREWADACPQLALK